MKAWQLLSSPKKFCKEVIAMDKHETPVMPLNRRACRWCLLGAVLRCYRTAVEQTEMLDRLQSEAIANGNFGKWSDTHGWRAVHRLLKRLDI